MRVRYYQINVNLYIKDADLFGIDFYISYSLNILLGELDEQPGMMNGEVNI